MLVKYMNSTRRHSITNLQKEFSSEEIVASLIKLFTDNNEIDYSKTYETSECSKYGHYYNKIAYNIITHIFSKLSLKKLESIFESLIDTNRRKTEGAVYTPDYIIDYIIDYSISEYRQDCIPIICDPACGSGGFLVRGIEQLKKSYNISDREALNYIKGIDLNSQSVSCAKVILELYLLSKGETPPSFDNNIICMDSLLTPKELLFNKLKISNGIDIIVTNPPYVKLQNISHEYRKNLIAEYPLYTNGSFSLAMLFLIRGYDLLSNSGILGYITQNNLFTSLASKNIRQYFQEKKCIHTIIDFQHTKIFANASAYTCLLFLTREQNKTFRFKWAKKPKENLYDNCFSKINYNSLNSKKWRLAPKNHLDNINKIESIGNKLGGIADIKVGFATLKDSVFLLRNDSKIAHEIEDDILKPAIKIAELNDQGDIEHSVRKIIFPYKKMNGAFIPIDEDLFRAKYPIAYDYLSSHKNVLLKRDKGKGSYKFFYEWGRTQGMESPSHKLLTKTFSNKPNFMLDKTSCLFCNGYSVKPKSFKDTLFSEQELNIYVLQKILNSLIMDYYSKLTSFQLDGNYQCFQKNFIEHFNIPNLNSMDIDFISYSDGSELDKYLSDLYGIKYDDLLEVVNR